MNESEEDKQIKNTPPNYKKAVEMENVKLGYQTAIELVNLTSQEVYSRFNAMLTANSIILATIGLILTNENDLPPLLITLFPVIGLIFCHLWFSLNERGVSRQIQFRNETIRIEKNYYSETFNLFYDPKDNSEKADSHYRNISRIVIYVFMLVYVFLCYYTVKFIN